MFIKQNLDGNIKERTVSGGNKHFMYIPKEDDSYPTVITESVILTIIVGTK